MKRRLALGVGVVLAAAGLLVLIGMSVGMGIACSTAATCLVLQHVQRGRVRASVGRLANAVRDLEVGCDIGVSGGTAANDPSAAIEDAAGRLRRLTQRCVDRLRTLTAQVAQLEGHHEETLAAVRGRTAFMASLCHEIRTPLNGLLGFLSMLNDSSLDDQQREWVDIARSSGESLLALLNDVLDLARIEAGKLTLERIEFDRDDLFENVAGLFAPTAHTRGVELLLHLDPGLPARLLGDPMRLRQVLANLVGNAVKFTSHGWIEITARAAERVGSKVALEITVADTGVGIPPERLAQLFVPFAQAEESTARRFGGSGLGLAIVKRIVEQMAGEISVDTELGRGTRFLVRLPISISGQAQAAPAPRPELALVIDGHDRRRELLGSMVQALGHETATAADAASALGALRAWAERSQPLVVIADDGAVLDDELIAGMRSRVGSRLIVLRPPAAAYDTVADGVDCVLVRPLRRAVLAAAIAGERHGAAPRGAASGPTWPGKRVLLVEDNAVNQRLMCTLLARMGVEVLLAGDGREAVAAFGRYTFDLILMDVQMPVMDGLEATQIIRSMQPSGPSVPIVALTANTQSGDREKCLLAGMNDYLTKPVRAAALRETMARFMPTSASALAGG